MKKVLLIVGLSFLLASNSFAGCKKDIKFSWYVKDNKQAHFSFKNNGSKTLPQWQDPDFRCTIEDITYEDVGHPDILDNTWANIAKNIGLWEMAETEKMDFKNWKFKVNTEIPKMRKKYRKFIKNSTP